MTETERECPEWHRLALRLSLPTDGIAGERQDKERERKRGGDSDRDRERMSRVAPVSSTIISADRWNSWREKIRRERERKRGETDRQREVNSAQEHFFCNIESGTG